MINEELVIDWCLDKFGPIGSDWTHGTFFRYETLGIVSNYRYIVNLKNVSRPLICHKFCFNNIDYFTQFQLTWYDDEQIS